MSIPEVIGLTSDIVSLFVLGLGAILALFVFFQLAPVLTLRILPSWTSDSKDVLKIRLEVENKSRIGVRYPKFHLQILEHRVEANVALSEWVPFAEVEILPDEQPLFWQDPVQVFGSTNGIYAGEVISIERLYPCQEDSTVIHVGLRVEIKQGFVGRVATVARNKIWTQYTTVLVVK